MCNKGWDPVDHVSKSVLGIYKDIIYTVTVRIELYCVESPKSTKKNYRYVIITSINDTQFHDVLRGRMLTQDVKESMTTLFYGNGDVHSYLREIPIASYSEKQNGTEKIIIDNKDKCIPIIVVIFMAAIIVAGLSIFLYIKCCQGITARTRWCSQDCEQRYHSSNDPTPVVQLQQWHFGEHFEKYCSYET